MKKITDAVINEFLDKISSNSAIAIGSELAAQLDNARQLIKSLESKQAVNDRKVLAALAIEVQQQVPVSVTFTRNTCHFTHGSRDLTVTLDWASGRWKVDGDHRIHRRFIKQGNATPITDDSLVKLAMEIASYFSSRYKRLAKEYTPGEYRTENESGISSEHETATQDEIIDELL